MKRHAKASSAATAPRYCARLGRRSAVAVLALAVALMVVSSAIAANGVVTFFGTEAQVLTKGGGEFAPGGPSGLSINQEGSGGAASGDLYVVDRSNNRVQQFSEAGAFTRAWGAGVVAGAATGTGTLTIGSDLVSTVSTTSGQFTLGQVVEGAGIPAGTRVVRTNFDVLELSKAATESGTGIAITAAAGTGNVPTNEQQQLTVNATGGGFLLTFTSPDPGGADEQTEQIAFDATAAEVQAALEALDNIGAGNVSVAGGPGDGGGNNPYTITFQGVRYTDTNINTLSIDASSLTGGAQVATVDVIQQGASGAEVCSAATDCVAGLPAAKAGGFNSPQGVAADQASGHVYVTDQANRRVDVFSATGTFEGAFGWRVNAEDPQEELQFCTATTGCLAGTGGAAAGQFGDSIGFLTVAPPGSPNAGHVYVANKFAQRVDEFAPMEVANEVTDVTFVRAWGWGVDTGAPEFEQCTTASTCQAANSSSPTGNPGQFSFNQPSAVAVDSSGDVYTAESSGNERLQKFGPSGNPVAYSAGALSGTDGPIDIAIDPSTDYLTVLSQCTKTACPEADLETEYRVFELDKGGNLVKTYLQDAGVSSGIGIARKKASDVAYMSVDLPDVTATQGLDETRRGVLILGTTVSPSVTVEPPSPLTANTATLRGSINPNGYEVSYRFEYSTDHGTTWVSASESDSELETGDSTVPVSEEISGLVAHHEYLFRLVASKPFDAGASTAGASFTTPASVPDIRSAFVANVTKNSAVLEAIIAPENEATTYHFEFGPSDCSANPCAHIPLTDAGIGSGEEPVRVLQEIGGLTPGATYHYRVVAANGSGVASSPDRRLTTPAREDVTNCPNEAFRTGSASRLPNCRAYEMVSPVEKNGADIGATLTNPIKLGYDTSLGQASIDGEKITFTSYKAFGDQRGSHYANQYISSRGSNGWSTHGIGPAHTGKVNPEYSYWDLENLFRVFTPDLSSAWLFDTAAPPLTGDAVENEVNLYQRNNANDTFHALTTVPPLSGTNGGGQDMEIQGLAPSGSHVVVSSDVSPITGDSTGGIFVHSNGSWHRVSVLPDGSLPDAAAAGDARVGGGSYERNDRLLRDISIDGSRVIWRASETSLYVRENSDQPQSALDGNGKCTEPTKACTITVQGPSADPVQYQLASTDGSRILYTRGNRETPRGLWEFNVDTEATTLVAGQVMGVVDGNSTLSRFYFVSSAELASGAVAGEENLYLDDEGTMRFIAVLTSHDVTPGIYESAVVDDVTQRSAQSSADGSSLAFVSESSNLSELVAGYDNRDAVTGAPVREIYVYDADAAGGQGSLVCASCNPAGSRPHSGFRPLERYGSTEFESVRSAAWLKTAEYSHYAPRNITSDGGRVFFNSFDALVPRDNNGIQDVYQWETQGSGGCQKAVGCISLISSGESPQRSEFVDASPAGRDVFFTTTSSLLPQDPALIDLYDAREGGGYPPALAGAASCEGEACQGLPTPPNDPTPASTNYSGPGNAPTAKRKPHKKKHKARDRRKKRNGKAKQRIHPRTLRNG